MVKKGDKVRLGQKIGQPRGFVSAPVHSSVSGEVKSIEIVDLPNGSKAPAVIIVNDGQDTPDESIKPDNAERLSADALKSIVTEAGIVGMGGAAFPTHVKLSPPDDRKIDILLLNGAECEPFLTSDYRLMIEHPDDILYGLKVIRKILGGVSRIYIGIEDNKPQAIKQMTAAAKNENDIQVVTLRTKYPQGAEKQLIYAITGRQVPSGGLPMDVGAVVQNVGTAAAIAFAVRDGLPLYRKLVTVSGGAVREQKNLMVRIGTSFREVIDFCGGWTEEPAKVINGRTYDGVAQYTLDVPVTKKLPVYCSLQKRKRLSGSIQLHSLWTMHFRVSNPSDASTISARSLQEIMRKPTSFMPWIALNAAAAPISVPHQAIAALHSDGEERNHGRKKTESSGKISSSFMINSLKEISKIYTTGRLRVWYEFFTVSASPHIRTRESTSRIMLDVVIALIPAGIASIWFLE